MSIVTSDSQWIHNGYGTDDRVIIDPKSGPRFRIVSGVGMDDRCRHWRLRPSHNTRAASGHKRLVRALLRYLSVSLDSVTGKRKTGITLSDWTRFAIALLIIMIGRLVLRIEGRGTFLIDLSRCWKEGCF